MCSEPFFFGRPSDGHFIGSHRNMAALAGARFLSRRLNQSPRLCHRRNRVKTKWATTLPKFSAVSLALQNFDVNYGLQLGDLWPSVRVALLCEQKYGALINRFSEERGVAEDLLSAGARDFIRSGAEDGAEVTPNLKCFAFPPGDVTRFLPARPDYSGALSHYLLDAASLLPVLALDVREGHDVLDLCAAPGGKTLAILQSQTVGRLTANDSSASRLQRLSAMLRSYVPKDRRSAGRVETSLGDGRMYGETARASYDRVLVDVPCTTDRHSVTTEENNVFKRSRTKERQSLPLLQTQLLLAGLAATRPGGVTIYSTCSLSPLQNEQVVLQAVRAAREELGVEVEPEPGGPLQHRYGDTFHFYPRQAVGELVVPHLTANFGPTYVCKLRRAGLRGTLDAR